jgi:hypothetical protein
MVLVVVEAAVVLVVVVVTDVALLTAGITAGAVFAAALEDGSWSRLDNTAELRCWAVCGGAWLAVDTGADVAVVMVGTDTGVMSAGVSVAVE